MPPIANSYQRIGLPQLLFKRNYQVLADLIEPSEWTADARDEIRDKLGAIVAAASSARVPAD